MSFMEDLQASNLPDGFKNLVSGYGKYSAEVAVARAIPAIDGLKPSQRRILYTMHKHKIKDLSKSANCCGKVLEFHPHSDASVYDTAILMVDSAEYTQFPFIHGKGNFSKVYFSDKDSQPAASRYTEMCLTPQSDTLFGEMKGIEFQPTEDGHTTEPVLLPASFPSILTTPTMGIAVGVACTIPSFNFNEILEATISYLRTGKFSSVIAPDFQCGGEYILNNNALRQIMTTGRGTIKLRGKWQIEGNEILITQIPFYSRISDILTKARQIPGVVLANDETDLYGMKIRITCKHKSLVDKIVLELLRDTGLQVSVGVNIGVVIDEEPVFTGVMDVIARWCEFRRGVLKKQYEHDLAAVRNSIRAPKALIELLSNQELKERFLNAMKISASEAYKVLREGLPDVDEDVIDYILDLKMRQFADVEGRKRQYQQLADKEQKIMRDLDDLNIVIINQLVALNNQYKIPRKTAIVTNDYSFESIEEERAAAKQIQNYETYIHIAGNRVSKFGLPREGMATRKVQNKQTLVMIDNNGRILRLPVADIPTSAGDVPAYIGTVMGIDNAFSIVDWDILEEKKIDYLYSDGYASQLDLSEWCGRTKMTKVTARGMPAEHVSKIKARLNFDYPYLIAITKNNKMGIIDLDYKRKSRTARTKLIGVAKDDEITSLLRVNAVELPVLFPGVDLTKYKNNCCAIDIDCINKDLWRQLVERG